ncbi:hypothetical protein VMCG_05400 [Cytospora schulzeri]|uniref:Uncharacterized protein n=1 Tax=Cytospora schulzeri TaxID=448051 RepID=A0A423WKA0_9PEZI|nr:hypothetical protein VMCG_05400 [Valsa malicola]
MPSSTSTNEAGSASTFSTHSDEIIPFRPRRVYTGEYHSKRRNSSRGSDSNGSRSSTGDYDREHHRKSLSRAVKAILKSEEAGRKAKAPQALELKDWIPVSFPPPYSNTSMEGLCMEFAQLATELQKGWTG